MIIKLKGFEIEGGKLIGRYSKFNLFNLHLIKSGTMKGKVLKRPEWYDTSLENCLKTIAQIRLNETKEELSVDGYLDRFEKISNQLKEDIDTVNKTLEKLIKQNEKI